MIYYINRKTKQEEAEKVYGQFFIDLVYGDTLWTRFNAFIFLPLLAHLPFFSKFYGWLQKSPFSKKKVKPFIETYQIDTSEFLDSPDSFASFNDFFIRKLKPSCRPIAKGNNVATLPADGRYLVYPQLDKCDGFHVKGHKFDLERLIQDHPLAHKYIRGSMALARLCPTDYHRFHFPCDGTPEEPKLINGPLYSVNPKALKHNIHILSQNKRVLTLIHSKDFGPVLYIEVGATCVGSINQTFKPHQPYNKGDEKGYFSFGGSCLIILFEPFRITFDEDLVEASKKGLETLGLFGQSLGHAIK